MNLILQQEKEILLDSFSAPKPQYIQLYADESNRIDLTFLNTFTGSIYVYDYLTAELKRTIKFSKEENGIKTPLGYYIKNFDSIYIYNKTNNEVVLINDSGKISSRISLIENHPFHALDWTYKYPQYYPSTAAPLIGTGQELTIPGQYMLSLPDSIAQRFKFETHIDLSNNNVSFSRLYPDSLYGHNYFWENEGLFTNVYCDLAPNNKMVYSFPVSHNLFVADKDKEGYSVAYGGSNEAGTIASFKGRLSTEKLILAVCKTDLYAGIRYDKFRKVYYRFLRKSMPAATSMTTILEKPLSVIVLDENFKYLGETTIGTCSNFNWENAFVTEEGLNIEYLDKKDLTEAYLHFKIFKPE
ncbi:MULTISPECIES: DUF4221 family protein [Niastella]|nr:DUF4221 family protein [Niastella soli]